MTIEIRLPELAPSMTSGRISSWSRRVGDAVRVGEVIAEVETEKSVVELESPSAGVIAEIRVPAGSDDITVNTVIALLVEGSGEPPPSNAADAVVRPDMPPSEMPARATSSAVVSSAPAEPASTQDANPKSPGTQMTELARRVAFLRGLSLPELRRLNDRGCIRVADLLGQQPRAGRSTGRSDAATSTVPAPEAAASPLRAPLGLLRKTIARRVTVAKQTIPHFYLGVECEISALTSTKRRLIEASRQSLRLSINDFVLRAVALALRRHPEINVRWADDAIEQLTDVDVALAVSTPHGLITPVIRHADRKGLSVISEEARRLAERARAGQLKPADYEGGSITVSNLGMFGVDTLAPIINPPHAVIVGIGRSRRVPVIKDDRIQPGEMLNCSISVDHRLLDGAAAARFLGAVREHIEDPVSGLLP